MKRKSLYVAMIPILLLFMASCGNKQQTSESSAPSSTSGKTVDAATAGSVSGSVQLNGTAPKMKIINMAAEPACATQHSSTPAMTQEVLVGKNGALENVVVYLKGDFSEFKFDPAQTPVTITQKGCMYDPHVLAMETGQPLQVVNADPVTHNIHPVPKDNREWNESQPPGAAPIDQSFVHEEIAIPVKCNIHPWMKGYIAVFNNPYFQVTGPDGSFNLKNVPPGSYTLIAWHELYGTTQQPVTVGPKESKTLQISFNAASPAD